MLLPNNHRYHFPSCFLSILLGLFFLVPAFGQDPSQTEKKVENPLSEADASRRAMRRVQPETRLSVTTKLPTNADEEVTITADRKEAQGNVVISTGNVHLDFSDITIYSDRITFNEATNDVVAEGNVFFEQQGQSVIAEKVELNLETKRGTLFTSTSYTDRTPDGTTVVIDATRTDKVGELSYNVENAKITACQEAVPKWSFTAKRARITINDKAVMYNPIFRIKNFPVLYLPYLSLSISKKERASGFLLPSSGTSNIKGRTLHLGYYQELGRSADILLRTDVFTKRGLGLGMDFRARPDENSRIAFGTFIVKDRLFGGETAAITDQQCAGQPPLASNPRLCRLANQGGSSFYADAVQYFKNGFVAVADVNITSNFSFRQVFAENAQQAISPEERSQFYVNKNFGAYSFNATVNEQSIFLGAQIIKTRQAPSFELNKRNEKISESFPIYFSFDSSMEGLKRAVLVGETSTFKTPSVSQRLDFNPRFTFPLKTIKGFTFTPSLALRSTFYSDSVNPLTQQIIGDNLLRNYADFSVDIRPPMFSRIYRKRDGSALFKHLIEPFITYRTIAGINDFPRTLRFDERDAIANTNEIEYGMTNRFLVKRLNPDGKSSQPYEWLTLSIAQKHFFDPEFGGALQKDKRNQFFPLNTLSGFSYLGYLRNFSPLSINAKVRPTEATFTDFKMDVDSNNGALRNLSFTGGLRRRLYQISQSWYLTRWLPGKGTRYDQTTLPGNQMDTSLFLGTAVKGPYMGLTVAYDLRTRFFDGTARNPRYINLITTGGWAWDCCSFQFQNYTFKAGFRNENRFLFSFTLRGIGTFGTDNIGQRRNRW